MKKYLVLIAATLINICAGGIYGWSVISNSLAEVYGYSNSQTQLIFGCCFIINTFSMLITGRLHAKYGSRKVTFAGLLLISSGYYLASLFCENYMLLLLSLGVILGLGISCYYITALSSISNMFVKGRGVASGIVVAGYGFGAIVLSKIFEHYYNLDYSIPQIFTKLSFIYGVLILLCFSLLPAFSVEIAVKKDTAKFTTYLKDKQYVAMIIGMFSCSFAGLLVIGNLKTIGINFELPANIVSLSIVFMAIGNSGGRIVWGAIFDRFYSKSLLFMTSLLGLGILGLCFLKGISALYLAMTLLATCCFGGCFSVYPLYISRIYGSEKLSLLYPPVIVFHGLACLIAAPIGGLCYDMFGDFTFSLILASIFAGIAMVSHLVLLNKKAEVDIGEAYLFNKKIFGSSSS